MKNAKHLSITTGNFNINAINPSHSEESPNIQYLSHHLSSNDGALTRLKSQNSNTDAGLKHLFGEDFGEKFKPILDDDKKKKILAFF